MAIVVLDLEWNGAYCKRVDGYFNEIIEIGAVRLDKKCHIEARFDAVIRPRVCRKLNHYVSDLTGYTDAELKDGTTFEAAMEEFHRFVGDKNVTLLTWSTTDLLVLMENCRYYYGKDEIPFITHYMDLQAYAQSRREIPSGQQVGLSNFAALLGMDCESFELHHAIDDSVLSAAILGEVYDKRSFAAAVRPVGDEFYRRVTFKPSFIKELDDPLVNKKHFRFRCPHCRKVLVEKEKWRFFHQKFQNKLCCPKCGGEYLGRVQLRRLFDGVSVKRRLLPKTEKAEKSEKAALV